MILLALQPAQETGVQQSCADEISCVQGGVVQGTGAWGCRGPLARHSNMRYGSTARQLPG